eukprot:maker-scaffold186_size273091-snap-gene-1.37 protein:Tk00920 transcript:maker-scaffold186_size273091-snap-gene-1.37-mRNA-1 annotation:"1-o-acylceramide synthase precursor"
MRIIIVFSLVALRIPGDGGSQIMARVSRDSPTYTKDCDPPNRWFHIWLNVMLLTYHTKCWTNFTKLDYDNVTRTTRNQPGVETKVLGFGNLTVVEYLDPQFTWATEYFSYITWDLYKYLGYENMKDIFSAPYDFRKAPNEMGDFFKKFKQLITDAFYANDNRRVILMCHSMGCPVTLYFLNHEKQAWKDKFVESMVTMSGAWGGTAKALRVLYRGESFNHFDPMAIREEERTNPSLAWMMPSSNFWGKDELVVNATYPGGVNATAKDLPLYFKYLNQTTMVDMFEDTKDLTHDLTPPGVEVHCLYGGGLSTVTHVEIKKTQSIVFPDLTYYLNIAKYGPTEGDGTVNQRSLEGCHRWIDQQEQPVTYKHFPKMEHSEILYKHRAKHYIRNLVRSINQRTDRAQKVSPGRKPSKGKKRLPNFLPHVNSIF